jgi:hypothetical protein
MKTLKPLVLAIGLAIADGTVLADEQQELLKLKNTTMNLIQILVEQGIMTQDKADQLIREAEAKAELQTQQAEREQATPKEKVVRVPYVPEYVKEDIRNEVREELRAQVVEDVMAQAKNERWGLPDALPDWVSRIKVKGDLRLRAEDDEFAAGNAPNIIDYQAVNEGDSDIFLNTTEDRQRLRERVRLGVDAKLSNTMKAGLRLSTGSTEDPVSTNQTLGNYNNRYDVVLDQAYLKYDDYNLDNYKWLTLSGGRMPNPFFSTDLVWDGDLGFEGLAATARHSLVGADNLWEQDEQTRNLFFTVGAFSLQEVELSSNDKWLFAGQLGVDWQTENQSTFTFATAYYNYVNIDGRQNPVGSTEFDYTAPQFMQWGNTVYGIGDPTDPTRLFGLAGYYKLLNLTASWDYAGFAPTHVILTGDYVKNLGWDKSEIRHRTNGVVFDELGAPTADIGNDTTGYQIQLAVGWPELRKARDWQVFGAWKHLESDAVLDAFTDSDFHLGGTNAEGWILGGSYGLADNTWLTGRWISADEIEGAPYGVDVIQLDLNTKF